MTILPKNRRLRLAKIHRTCYVRRFSTALMLRLKVSILTVVESSGQKSTPLKEMCSFLDQTWMEKVNRHWYEVFSFEQQVEKVM